jgi:hypothetical protein
MEVPEVVGNKDAPIFQEFHRLQRKHILTKSLENIYCIHPARKHGISQN